MESPRSARRHGRGALVVVAAALLAVALGIAAWLAQRGGDGGSAASSTAAGSAAPAPAAGQELRSASRADEARATAPAGEQPEEQGAAAEAASETEPQDRLLVRVVERASGAPVPDAEVLWLRLPDRSRPLSERARSLDKVESLLEEQGARARADEAGLLRIARGPGTLVIVGRTDTLWGRANLAPDPPGDLRLEVSPDLHVDVEVVDRAGVALAGVPVALRALHWGRRTDVETVRTGADGRARLPHVQFVTEGVRNATWLAGATVLLREPVEVELDLEDLPAAPVRLVLPYTGSVAVRVLDVERRPARGLGRVFATVELPEEEGWPRARPEDRPYAADASELLADGRARFAYVEPGLDLRLEVRMDDAAEPTRARSAGPAAAGREVAVEVVLGSDHPVVRLRALDAEGAPLAERELKLALWDGDDPYRGARDSARTDTEGRLDVDVEPQRPDRPTQRLRLLAEQQDGGPPLSGELELPRGLRPGLNDLGDLRLAAPPLVAAGRVVDAEGEPLAGATVSALIVTDKPAGRLRGLGYGGAVAPRGPVYDAAGVDPATSGDDGSFALHGHVGPLPLRLVADRQGFASGEAFCDPGARDVRVELERHGELRGRLLLGQGLRGDAMLLQLRLEEADGVRPEALVASGAWTAGQLQRLTLVAADGTFSTSARGGSWSLQPRARLLRLDFPAVEGIVLVPGEVNEDPRVNPLDLRSLASAIRLELAPPERGTDLRGVVVWTETGGEGQGVLMVNGPVLELVARGAPLELRVACAGYRFVHLPHVVASERVELEPALRVRVRLPEGLRWEDPSVRIVAALREVYHGPLLHPERVAFDGSGVARLQAGASGPAQIELLLERGRRVTVLGAARPVHVDESAADQTFDVDLTQEQLDAGLAVLASGN